jgi:ribonuclease VapC
VVLDTSAILAIFFNEEKGPSIARILEANSTNLRMSTVNLTETLILLEDRQPQLFEGLKVLLLGSNIRFVAPDPIQAAIAANARMRLPLNLGDCFAYALCKVEDCPLLTLDDDFKKTDIRLVEIN